MRRIRSFDEYLQDGVVHKISVNTQRALFLREEAKRKLALLQKNIDAMGVDDENANDYVEYCYNIVMFLLRSKMFLSGFMSSGPGAHEAEVAFSERLGFSEDELSFLDQLRYFRNGILYYGKRFDAEYAHKVISFCRNVAEHLGSDK